MNMIGRKEKKQIRRKALLLAKVIDLSEWRKTL